MVPGIITFSGALGFAPWSICQLAIARLQFWQRTHWRFSDRSPAGFICPVLVYRCFGFFTIAVTKLPNYVLPLMPAAAVLVALLWSEEIKVVASSPPILKGNKTGKVGFFYN